LIFFLSLLLPIIKINKINITIIDIKKKVGDVCCKGKVFRLNIDCFLAINQSKFNKYLFNKKFNNYFLSNIFSNVIQFLTTDEIGKGTLTVFTLYEPLSV